jgi:oxaloacetate decarboxylase gamma subunit
MTISEMLGQSGVLTLMGMGTVFLFLVILVLCVSAMGSIFQILGKNKAEMAPGAVPAGAISPDPTIAAITAAVTEYRKTH